MSLWTIAALAMHAVTASPVSTGSAGDQALSSSQALAAGQLQLGNLNQQERLDLLALDRWLRSQEGIRPSETRQKCIDRLISNTPTKLESALLDLKCSQRPEGNSAR